MKATILNDIHIGTQRQAGTTPASQAALKEFINAQFRSLVHRPGHGMVIINGDLFDRFTVDTADILAAYDTLAEYIKAGGRLALCAGNHDSSAKAGKVSSFDFLAHLLASRFPQQVQVITHACGLTGVLGMKNTWAIPHMLNQALFDLEIGKAAGMAAEGQFLLLHCNVESPFAEHADHSLNLDGGQIERLLDAGWTLIVGHEHQSRSLYGGRVLVTGNQIPSSVADCLNNPGNKKQHVVLVEAGNGLEWTLRSTVNLDDCFVQIDWRDIEQCDLATPAFIRVEGRASAAEAADMVAAVARLRSRSDAFVISNAVQVEGMAQMESLAEMSLESVSRFDVLQALLEDMDEREQKTILSLLEG